MPCRITTFDEAFVEQIVSVYNRENEAFEFVVPLSTLLFEKQILSKSVFSKEGSFVLLEKDHVVGFALTCQGADRERRAPDPEIGVIDGVFFPEDKYLEGERLIRHCVAYLEKRGAKTIYGFASFGGYPFWRGLYCGFEPVCLTDYKQAWIGFMSCGFEHHQQSINYLGKTRVFPYRRDLDYGETKLDICSAWQQDSWAGLEPKILTAGRNGEEIGRIGFGYLPHLSEHRGVSTAGIYSLHVVESMRGKGIASSLMAKLFEVLGDDGVQEVLVGTTAENAAARATYQKAGMEIVGFRTGTRLVVTAILRTATADRSELCRG